MEPPAKPKTDQAAKNVFLNAEKHAEEPVGQLLVAPDGSPLNRPNAVSTKLPGRTRSQREVACAALLYAIHPATRRIR